MKKKEQKKITLKKKLIGFIFDRSPRSNLSQFNKIVIKNFKLKWLEPEKVTIK